MAIKHVGFNGAAASVAKKQNLPMDRARAIIAAGARNASETAKKNNPRLRRVQNAAQRRMKNYSKSDKDRKSDKNEKKESKEPGKDD